MTYKDVDSERLKYLLSWGSEVGELRRFFAENRLSLIQAGAKVQNLPKGQEKQLDAICRFNAKANTVLERWWRTQLGPTGDVDASEILTTYTEVEAGSRKLSEDEHRRLSRAALRFIFSESDTSPLLDFLKMPVRDEQGESAPELELTGIDKSRTESSRRHAFLSAVDLQSIADAVITQGNTDVDENSSDVQRFLASLEAIRSGDVDRFNELASTFPEEGVLRELLEINALSQDESHSRGIRQLSARELGRGESIDLDTVEVVAQCSKIIQGNTAFLQVFGFLDQGGFVTAPRNMLEVLLPETGDIILFANAVGGRIPREGTIAAWRVALHDTDKRVKVHVTEEAHNVFEVRSIPIASGDVTELRQYLTLYRNIEDQRPVFQCSDRVVFRPRRDLSDVVRDDFKEPMDAWDSLVGFSVGGRTFVLGPLPERQRVLDCASPDVLLPRVLALGNQMEGAVALTKAQARTIVDVAQTYSDSIDSTRLGAVREYLKRHLQERESVSDILELVLANPRIQGEIQQAKANAASEALVGRDQLKGDIKRLQDERASLEKSLRQREADSQTLPGRISKAVRRAFEKAKADGLETLGSVAVFEQFLKGSSVASSANPRLQGGQPALEWAELPPVSGDISSVLSANGVSLDATTAIETGVRLAQSAGCIVVLEGLTANNVADQLAVRLTTKRSWSTTIDIGILGPDHLRQQLYSVKESGDTVVLKAVNQSDFDSYGSELLDWVISRIANREKAGGTVFVTSAAGPTSLPMSEKLSRLSVTIDLDESVIPESARGAMDFRQALEEAERGHGRQLWPPLRARLLAAADDLGDAVDGRVTYLLCRGLLKSELKQQ